MAEISPQTFALQNFLRGSQIEYFRSIARWEQGLDLVLGRVGQLSSFDAMNLGVALEERILIALGLEADVFPNDHAILVLREADVALGTRYENTSTDQRARLPLYMSVDELLGSPATVDEESSESFASALRFRFYERGTPQRSFIGAALFGHDREWQSVLDRLTEQVTSLRDDEVGWSALSLVEEVFDTIVVCADALSVALGRPIADSDPWMLGGLTGDRVPEFYVESVPKGEDHVVTFIRSMAQHLLSARREPDPKLDPRAEYLLREVGMLQLLHYARLPDVNQDPGVVRNRVEVIQSLNPGDQSSIAVAIGSKFTWIVPLWRLAAPDSRSLSRVQAAVNVCVEAVDWIRTAHLELN